MRMDVSDGNKFQGPFGVHQMSYGHFGQDKMSANWLEKKYLQFNFPS